MIKVFFVFLGVVWARRPGLVWGRGACGRLSARIFMCGAATAVYCCRDVGAPGARAVFYLYCILFVHEL